MTGHKSRTTLGSSFLLPRNVCPSAHLLGNAKIRRASFGTEISEGNRVKAKAPYLSRAAVRRPVKRIQDLALIELKKKTSPIGSSGLHETRHSFLDLTIDIVRYSALIGVSILVILVIAVLTLKLLFSLVGPD